MLGCARLASEVIALLLCGCRMCQVAQCLAPASLHAGHSTPLLAPCILTPSAAVWKLTCRCRMQETAQGVICVLILPCPMQESAFSGVFRYLANGTEFTKVTKFEASGGCRQLMVPLTVHCSGLKCHWFEACGGCSGSSRCPRMRCSLQLPCTLVLRGICWGSSTQPAVPLQQHAVLAHPMPWFCCPCRTGAGAGRVLCRIRQLHGSWAPG